MRNVVVWRAVTDSGETRYVVTRGDYKEDAEFVLEARYPRETILQLEVLDEGIYYEN